MEKIHAEDRYNYLKNIIDEDKFSLVLSGSPSKDGILSVINFLRAVHKQLGDSKEAIRKKYLQGSCISLVSLIKAAYTIKGVSKYEIEFVRFTSPYDKSYNELRQDFYDHYTARLKSDKDTVYDIDGAQTMAQMREKLSALWTKDGKVGKVTADDIWDNLEEVSIRVGCPEVTYCKGHIEHKLCPRAHI